MLYIGLCGLEVVVSFSWFCVTYERTRESICRLETLILVAVGVKWCRRTGYPPSIGSRGWLYDSEVTVSSAATMEQPPHTERESTTTGDMARPVVAKINDSDTPPTDSGSLENAVEGCKNKRRLLAAKTQAKSEFTKLRRGLLVLLRNGELEDGELESRFTMLEEAHDRASEILEELLSMYANEHDSQNQEKIISQLEELESQLSKTGDFLHECTYADRSKQMITHAPPVGFALAESRPTSDQIDQRTDSWFRKYVHAPSSASEHTCD